MLARTVLIILLMASLTPQAKAAPERTCSPALLKGRYVFTGHGYIEPIEPGVERVHYGFFEFDGRGRLTGKQSSSRGGKIGREELEGEFTLNADCSGTLTFRHVARAGTQTYGPGVETHWDMYVTQDGRSGNILRTDDGTMAVRTFQR
jgi:hypothetical protein